MTALLNVRALRLSYFSVGWNVVEGAISLIAGALAGSTSLIGFGLDSFIESLSGSIMIWRFFRHERYSEAELHRREQRAVTLVGYTFFLLGAFVLYDSCDTLLSADRPEVSHVGIVITALSLVIMPMLYILKRNTGRALNSHSLVADSRQTLACSLLSLAVLAGLLLNALVGFWQADPIIGLAIAAYLCYEGFQALKKKELCNC